MLRHFTITIEGYVKDLPDAEKDVSHAVQQAMHHIDQIINHSDGEATDGGYKLEAPEEEEPEDQASELRRRMAE